MWYNCNFWYLEQRDIIHLWNAFKFPVVLWLGPLITPNVTLQMVDFAKKFFQNWSAGTGHHSCGNILLNKFCYFSTFHFHPASTACFRDFVITCNCFSSRMPSRIYSDQSQRNPYSSTPFVLTLHRALWLFPGLTFFI